MAAITMRNVHKAFGNVHVIKGIDLDIRNKDFIVFVGPSGCASPRCFAWSPASKT